MKNLIAVTGYTSQKFECDYVTYILKFIENDEKGYKAIKEVNDNLNDFLSILQKNGFPIEEFRMDKNIISNDSFWESKNGVIARREIKIDLPCKSSNVNMMLSIIEKNKIPVMIDEFFFISNQKELENDVLDEAMKDARRKAEIIAKNSNSKIIGIHNVNVNSTNVGCNLFQKKGIIFDSCVEETKESEKLCDNLPSNNLGAFIKEIECKVSVTWLVKNNEV
ncbi:MAG: SIMPL domain-containing protein [Selenomonadaceae bacterium]|nr:SIMPL domain-containing protein [Selenomonadaceae bacterium]